MFAFNHHLELISNIFIFLACLSEKIVLKIVASTTGQRQARSEHQNCYRDVDTEKVSLFPMAHGDRNFTQFISFIVITTMKLDILIYKILATVLFFRIRDGRR